MVIQVQRMATSAITRAWQTVKPHVPLIKFRKGGLPASGAHGGNGAVQSAAPQQTVQAKSMQKPILEDYQLPLKYRRRPLEEKEIEYINRGGRE